ncbi:Unknown protein, partial [Striga hermonthica]
FAEHAADTMLEAVKYTEDKQELNNLSSLECCVDGSMIWDVVVGQSFRDKNEVIKLLNHHAITNQYQFKVEKSCPKQYYVKCICTDCKWYVKASRVENSNIFKIRGVGGDHSCPFEIRTSGQRQATSNIVSGFIRSRFTNLKTTYVPGDIIHDMQVQHGIELSYQKAWRSKRKAMDEVRGNPDMSYGKINEYLQKVCESNPNSVVKLSATSDQHFMYVFMCLNASIKGWNHCRPIIVVDGTFLSSTYGGILLTACCQDANSHILPLAFCIVDSENNDSYTWFFTKLREVLTVREGLCIVSDRHGSIKHAVAK